MKRKSFLKSFLLFSGFGVFKNSQLFAAYTKTQKFFLNKVKFIWAGAVTTNSVKVNAKLTSSTSSARLVVSTSPSLSSPVFGQFTNADLTNNLVAKLSMAGLSPGTTYYYGIEADGQVDLAVDAIGTFKTVNNGSMSFKFSVASCNQNANHPVFLRVKEKAPLLHITHGDFHYGNPNSATDINIHRAPFETALGQPNMKEFLREVPIAYMWDDHDYCGDNTNGSAAGRTNARLVFQEYVPHFPLVAGSGDVPIYQAFTIGRVRFVMTDLRSERGTSILGTTQKDWFKNECLAAKNADLIIIWINSVPWGSTTDMDTWGGFSTERTELSDFFKTNAIRNLFIICGDAHMIGVDNGNGHDFSTGASNPYKYPVLHAAAINQVGSFKGGVFSEGYFINPSVAFGQYALVEITDNGGSIINVSITGYRVTDTGIESVLLNYSFTFSVLSVLPVIISRFSVKPVQNYKALLSWEIVSLPGDCHQFAIERSSNGVSFKELGTVNCNQWQGSSSFSFTDQQPLPGENFYRIKILKPNRTATYSAIERMNFSSHFKVVIVANPAKDLLKLSIQSLRDLQLEYFIKDAAGRTVLHSSLQVFKGLNNFSVRLEGLHCGTYFLYLFNKSQSSVYKFVVA